MIISKSILLLTILTIVAVLVASAYSQDALLISYQGRLTDETGEPVNGSPAITFTIYDGGGVSKWAEEHSSVPVTDGLFSVTLGSQTALPDSVFNGEDRYLGISVEGDEEIDPRTQLTSAPGAAVSRRVAGDIHTGPRKLLIGSDTGDSAIVLMAQPEMHAIQLHPPEPCVPPDPCEPALEMVAEPDTHILRLHPPDPCVPPEPCGPAFEIEAAPASNSMKLYRPGDSLPAFTVSTDNIEGDYTILTLGEAAPAGTKFLPWKVESIASSETVTLTMGSPLNENKHSVEMTASPSAATVIVQGEDLLGDPPQVAVVAGPDGAKVGIGTGAPAEALDVNGTTQTTAFKMPTDAADGYVLTSDDEGNGTWQASASTMPKVVTGAVNGTTHGVTGKITVWFNAGHTDEFSSPPAIFVDACDPASGLTKHGEVTTTSLAYFEVQIEQSVGGALFLDAGVDVRYMAIGQ